MAEKREAADFQGLLAIDFAEGFIGRWRSVRQNPVCWVVVCDREGERRKHETGRRKSVSRFQKAIS